MVSDVGVMVMVQNGIGHRRFGLAALDEDDAVGKPSLLQLE